jgi:hypothetical protein
VTRENRIVAKLAGGQHREQALPFVGQNHVRVSREASPCCMMPIQSAADDEVDWRRPATPCACRGALEIRKSARITSWFINSSGGPQVADLNAQIEASLKRHGSQVF